MEREGFEVSVLMRLDKEPVPSFETVVERLGRVNRFAGAVEYSVLQHSAVVGMLVMVMHGSMNVITAAYLHDFHEAITGDVRAPFKTDEQRSVEFMVQDWLMNTWQAPWVTNMEPEDADLVSRADEAAAAAEMRVLGLSDAANDEEWAADELTRTAIRSRDWLPPFFYTHVRPVVLGGLAQGDEKAGNPESE